MVADASMHERSFAAPRRRRRNLVLPPSSYKVRTICELQFHASGVPRPCHKVTLYRVSRDVNAAYFDLPITSSAPGNAKPPWRSCQDVQNEIDLNDRSALPSFSSAPHSEEIYSADLTGQKSRASARRVIKRNF